MAMRHHTSSMHTSTLSLCTLKLLSHSDSIGFMFSFFFCCNHSTALLSHYVTLTLLDLDPSHYYRSHGAVICIAGLFCAALNASQCCEHYMYGLAVAIYTGKLSSLLYLFNALYSCSGLGSTSYHMQFYLLYRILCYVWTVLDPTNIFAW